MRNFSRRYDSVCFLSLPCSSHFVLQYDRIDPAEMQLLKDEIAQLQAQNAELKAAAERQGSDTTSQLAKVRTHPLITRIPFIQRSGSLRN